MRVLKVRLKNIKSYGVGDGGKGIIIELAPGINQIAGPNGAGKSTIIEAIGFALFNATPLYGDGRLGLNTYLLRHGTKQGEIDVWVEHDQCVYRIERDLGAAFRRWKVVREGEEFIEAQDEAEVTAFLCQITGASRPERLAELFHSLVGVKQGRFTQPFDCRGAQAKAHFDPLLDVDIFRQCFDYLKNPLDQLQGEINQLANQISGVAGEVKQLSDAPERMAAARLRTERARESCLNGSKLVMQAERAVQEHEAAWLTLQQGEELAKQTLADLEKARLNHRNDLQRVAESQQGQAVLEQCREQYQAYLSAEQIIARLAEERTKRDSLLSRQNELKNRQTGLSLEIKHYLTNAENARQQAGQKAGELAGRENTWQELRQQTEQAEGPYDRQSRQVAALEQDLHRVLEWGQQLQLLVRQAGETWPELKAVLTKLSRWDQAGLSRAQEQLDRAEKAENQSREGLSRARQKKDTLERQLDQIGEGTCPFLGERCRQFDPAKVRSDVARLSADIALLVQQWQEQAAGLDQAKQKLAEAQEQDKNRSAMLSGARQAVQLLIKALAGAENISGRQAADNLQLTFHGLRADLPVAEVPAVPPDWQQGLDLLLLEGAVESLNILYRSLRSHYQTWQGEVTAEQQKLQAAGERRAALMAAMEKEAENITLLKQETQKLALNAEENLKLAGEKIGQCQATENKLMELSSTLQQYEKLDQELQQVNLTRNAALPFYTRYVQHQSLAEAMETRVQAAGQSELLVNRLAGQHQAAMTARDQAALTYNREKHQADRELQMQAHQALGTAQREAESAGQELLSQEKRVGQLDQLLIRKLDLSRQRVALTARGILMEKARSVLKKAQGPVAGSLTKRIAARAQSIYNRMSPEPAQFVWEPKEYKLTMVTVSGEKRFPQLSGGQQMKVALAMQLALVQEFSRVGFCVFDEPTYGLDAESRELLSEALVAAQAECQFEQLLVVSHDQAFDDKVEYSVRLKYEAAAGTNL